MPVQGPGEFAPRISGVGRSSASKRTGDRRRGDVNGAAKPDIDVVEISEQALQLRNVVNALRELPDIRASEVAASQERLASGELYAPGRLRVAARRILDTVIS